jgi:hypothetical protein
MKLILDDLKNDFDEVGEAMFQGVDGTSEHILIIQGIEKSDFAKVA